MTINNRYYEKLDEAWWDPTGPLGSLLQMNPFRYRYFRTVLGKPEGVKLLDVGCGGGFLAEAFAREGAEVYGLDLSPRSLRIAREHARIRGLLVRTVTGRAQDLPFRSGVFDAVLLADLLEHMEDFETAIAESSRVLKPGGILLYETVNRTLLSWLGAIWVMERILKKIPLHSHEWKMFIRPAELVKALDACGLRNQETRGLAFKGGVPGFVLRFLKGQDPWIFETGRDTRLSYLGHAVKPG